MGLRVWNAKNLDNMFWAPEVGNIREPEGWDFLPSGNSFFTRTVKSLDPYWILLRRHKKYTPTIGILCPSESITSAKKIEEETRESRRRRNKSSLSYRQKAELKYQREIEKLMLDYFNFSGKYKKLAEEICRKAAGHATVTGSGRVGRTKTITAEERAILAVRAHIRHNYTRYEEELTKSSGFNYSDKELHRVLKGEAAEAVNEFIWKHQDHNKGDQCDSFNE